MNYDALARQHATEQSDTAGLDGARQHARQLVAVYQELRGAGLTRREALALARDWQECWFSYLVAMSGRDG